MGGLLIRSRQAAKLGEEFYERIYIARRLIVSGSQKLCHVQFPLC